MRTLKTSVRQKTRGPLKCLCKAIKNDIFWPKMPIFRNFRKLKIQTR